MSQYTNLKIATDGLVFAYDMGDRRNSWVGQPGTNITTGVGKNYNGYSLTTYSGGMFFETNGYTETVNILAIGNVSVESIEIENAYCGYGCNGNFNCCPNLFNYTGGWMSPIWTGNTTYTYQIIYKCQSGYTHPNFMYHYEYDSSNNYLTEYGVFNGAYQEALGDGWYHAWNTFTTNASAAKGYTGLWYYQYNIQDKVSIAAVSIAPGNTIRPYNQLIPSATTRSNTQGLLDLSGKGNSLNLANVSFDSNAQMTFDGTNDYIDIPTNFGTLSQYTIEHVSYKGSENRMPVASRVNTDFYQFGDNSWKYKHGGINGEYYYPQSFTINGWGHWTIVYDGSYVKIYRNGIFEGQQATSGTANWTDGMKIGYWAASGGYAWNGQIAIVKMYNRALSTNEVQQNYQSYKKRFNLA